MLQVQASTIQFFDEPWRCKTARCHVDCPNMTNAPITRSRSAACFVTYRCLLRIRDSSVGAIRHRSIRMRNDRHNRHSGGECKGQGEDYGYLFHDRVPFAAAQPCQKRLGASLTDITLWRFSTQGKRNGQGDGGNFPGPLVAVPRVQASMARGKS